MDKFEKRKKKKKNLKWADLDSSSYSAPDWFVWHLEQLSQFPHL